MRWEQLNAYVDGELPPDEAADVAEAIAREPVLAREVAALTALKASVAQAAPPHPGPLSKLPCSHRNGLRVAAIAATLVVGLLFGIAWHSELHRPAPGPQLALELHQTWSSSREEGHPDAMTKVGFDSLQLAYVPDLTRVELAFGGVRQIRLRGGRGLHVGYQGPRGCAVSLVVFSRPGSHDKPLGSLDLDAAAAWHWVSGGVSFYLIAPSMDPSRLAGIARVVHRLTRARLPLDPAGVLALEEARSGAEPCLA
jgi:anti-sigma factor RsiW